MRFLSGIVRLIVGVLFGLVAGMALVPALAAFQDGPESKSPLLFFVVVAISAALGLFAPSIRRAFGRGFLLAGVCFLLLPLSVMLLSGRAAQDMVSTADASAQAPAAIGAGLAGVAMTGAATFIGLIVGAVFIIIGLVLALGGRREVIVVTR